MDWWTDGQWTDGLMEVTRWGGRLLFSVLPSSVSTLALALASMQYADYMANQIPQEDINVLLQLSRGRACGLKHPRTVHMYRS
jgi:hypothetical protein